MNERIRTGTVGAPLSGIRRVGQHDDEFPEQLRAIPDAPACLYVRGALLRDDALAVAVVGSRRATAYGEGVAEALGAELAARGVTVVSGLARGIDTAAHRGALRGGGRTLAVLGSGVDVIYPPENRGLAGLIESRGALLSPFLAGTPPLPHHFPLRNRVIAGLTLAVVVVEAAERSGALITARLAAEFGREVMAVPGPVTSPGSRGTHALIRDGAALVEGWEDVVAGLPARWRECVAESGPAQAIAPEGPRASGDEELVLGAVGAEPTTIDDIIEQSGVSSARVAALLLTLELDGRIRRIEGERFVRIGASRRGEN